MLLAAIGLEYGGDCGEFKTWEKLEANTADLCNSTAFNTSWWEADYLFPIMKTWLSHEFYFIFVHVWGLVSILFFFFWCYLSHFNSSFRTHLEKLLTAKAAGNCREIDIPKLET
jgi:hypothetical protein